MCGERLLDIATTRRVARDILGDTQCIAKDAVEAGLRSQLQDAAEVMLGEFEQLPVIHCDRLRIMGPADHGPQQEVTRWRTFSRSSI